MRFITRFKYRGITLFFPLLFLLPLPTQAQGVFDIGNCYCISTTAPYAVTSCTDNTHAFNCTVKQQATELCITDTGTQTQCDAEENKAFTKTANGNCTCKIEGKPDAVYYNVTPDNCAAQKKGLVDDNEGKTVFCAYESSDKANCLCTLSDDDIFSPDDKDQTALATSDQAACEAKSTSNDDFEYQGQTWNAKCAWQGTFAEQLEANEAAQAATQPQKTFPAPSLSVPIPGLGALKPVVEQEGKITLPWLGQYISAAYSFGIGIATVFAIIMMMIGGIQYLTAAGDSGRIGSAKEKIRNSLFGLLLLMCSYLILFTINPNIIAFKLPTIDTIAPDPVQYQLSSAQYQAVTGEPLPPITDASKAEIIKAVGTAADQAGVPRCLAQTLAKFESGGAPNVIGHDENFNRASDRLIGARVNFLHSGKTFTGKTFPAGPSYDVVKQKAKSLSGEAKKSYLGQIYTAGPLNDDVGRRVDPTKLGPPDYGIDWRFTHGFGIGQITNQSNEATYCDRNGQKLRGLKRGGECFTIPELLTIEGGANAMVALLKFYYTKACWNAPGGTLGTPQEQVDDLIIKKTIANWGTGCGSGSSIPWAETRTKRFETYKSCIANGGTLVP